MTTTITDLDFKGDDPGTFRLLQKYTDKDVWIRLGPVEGGGDPLIALLCRQFPVKALKNFTVHAKGEEAPHDLSPLIRKKLKPFEGEKFNVVESDLAFSEGLMTFTKDVLTPATGDTPATVRIFFEGFYKEQYKESIERDNHGDMIYVKAEKQIKGQTVNLTQSFGTSTKSLNDKSKSINGNSATVKPLPIEDVLLVGSIPAKDKGDFRPWIGPIWDDAYSWSKISISATLFCIRVGPGLFVFRATPAFIKENRGLIDEMMGKYAGEVTIISLPIIEGVALNDTDPKLEQVTATQVNFDQLKSIPLGRISAYTGAPQSAIEGLTLGNQVGAEYTQQDVFELYQVYQEKFRKIDEFETEKLRLHDPEISELPEDFEIRYDNRIEQTEIGKADLDNKRMDLVEKLMKFVEEPKDAFKLAGFNIGEVSVTKPEPIEFGEDDDDDSKDPKEKDEDNPDEQD